MKKLLGAVFEVIGILGVLWLVATAVLLSGCGGVSVPQLPPGRVCEGADCDCYVPRLDSPQDEAEVRWGGRINWQYVKCETEPPPPPPPPPPSPSPDPTPIPTPTPLPEPTPLPSPPPPPEDCSKYTPYAQAWNPLVCILRGKQVCGTPTDKACGCNGDECSFDVPQGAACHLDSTPRYWASTTTPCWKDGRTTGHCEYPPNSKCGSATAWKFPSGVEARIADDYGATVKFPNRGAFDITAGRKDKAGFETTKTARVR